MSEPELQSVAPAEISQGTPLAKTLLALNNAHAQELSWLEPERLPPGPEPFAQPLGRALAGAGAPPRKR